MDLHSLPKIQADVLPEFRDFLSEPLDDQVIRGNVCDEMVEAGDFQELVVGEDVVVYTLSVSRRPWVGRIVELLTGDTICIHYTVVCAAGKAKTVPRYGEFRWVTRSGRV